MPQQAGSGSESLEFLVFPSMLEVQRNGLMVEDCMTMVVAVVVAAVARKDKNFFEVSLNELRLSLNCLAQVSFELMIFLSVPPPPPGCWDSM